MEAIGGLFGIFIMLVVAAFYFIPTVVALARKKENVVAIFILNLLLGWSFIGWVIALVWACTTKPESLEA
ncbi:superinfection immunity protein [Alteribacter aurantiacus]|uniref:superinfection immunity protein n=1 Tax=Alteribacter aurantiacus TaxID=254410 RepID=UPI00041A0D06|nr:superinfection immunity protein [Alteribacter aurantiacus]